jgi:GSH-dependent disulfide-bond oxidoreductase
MIDVHFWPTPNGHKIIIYLEEIGLPYRLVPVNIGRGDQLKPDFLAISPNNKIPAIVDHAPADGGGPLSVFESAAILQYLGEKTGKLFPRTPREKKAVLEWLSFQIAHVGPAMGQLGHFKIYSDEKIPYAIRRFEDETHRLYSILERRLGEASFVAGEYSIADIALFPWIRAHARYDFDMEEFPHVTKWIDRIAARPAVERALAIGEELAAANPLDDAAKKVLFNQRGGSARR